MLIADGHSPSFKVLRTRKWGRLALSLSLGLIQPSAASAAPSGHSTTSASAHNRILQTILISKISDLNFGDSPQGDGEKTIEPGATENSQNASFRVSGEANRNFFIILPTEKIEMHNLSQPSARPLKIGRFRSFPDQRGILNQNGEAFVFVGATREAVLRNQPPGQYTGSFTLTVIY